MMRDTVTGTLAAGSGSLVGLVLGLVRGGGSILTVPLPVYVVGVSPPHIAIGTSAVAVSVSPFGLLTHWRAGNVKWRCATVFASAGGARRARRSGVGLVGLYIVAREFCRLRP